MTPSKWIPEMVFREIFGCVSVGGGSFGWLVAGTAVSGGMGVIRLGLASLFFVVFWVVFGGFWTGAVFPESGVGWQAAVRKMMGMAARSWRMGVCME